MENTKTYLEKGRLGKAENEIAVSKHYMESYGLKLGDSVDVKIEKTDFNKGKPLYTIEKEFIIVGVLEDNTRIYNVGFAHVSETYKDKIQKTKHLEVENASITLRSSESIIGNISYLADKYDISSTVKCNYELIIAIDDSGAMVKMNIVINILIMVAITLVIGNILYFNLLQKNKDLGIMKCLGFRSKELHKVVYGEIILYILPGFIIGISLAKLVIYFESNLLVRITGLNITNSETISNSIDKNDIIVAIILVVLAVIPSCIKPILEISNISPILVVKAGRENVEIKISKFYLFLVSKIKIRMNRYAFKNLMRNRKRTVITVISIAFSTILISLILCVMNMGDMETLLRQIIPGDIYIEFNMYSQNAETQEAVYSHDVWKELNKMEGVKKVDGSLIKTYIALLNSENMKKSRKFKKANANMLDGKYIDFISVIGITNYSEYCSNNILSDDKIGLVITKNTSDFWGVNIGDQIYICLENDLYEEKNIPVIIENIIEKDKFGFSSGYIGETVYMELEDLEKVRECKGFDRFDIYVKKNIDSIQIRSQIKTMQTFENNTTIKSFEEEAQYYVKRAKTENQIKLICIIIMAALSSIGCFNSIYSSIMNRKSEYMNLYIIGISKKEILKSAIYEGKCYSFFGILYTIPFQILFLFLYKITSEETKISKSLILMYFGIDFSLIIVCSLIALFSAKYIIKQMSLTDISCN